METETCFVEATAVSVQPVLRSRSLPHHLPTAKRSLAVTLSISSSVISGITLPGIPRGENCGWSLP